MSIKLSQKQKELIESFGVIQEKMGMAPAPSRVNALLTVADQSEMSFDDIREALQLSKSATSNAINNLLSLDRIGYRTKPGDRKRYFYSKLDQWRTAFRKDILALNHYNAVMNEILSERTAKTEDYNHQLKELIMFMEYFIKESIDLIDNWKKK